MNRKVRRHSKEPRKSRLLLQPTGVIPEMGGDTAPSQGLPQRPLNKSNVRLLEAADWSGWRERRGRRNRVWVRQR